MLRAHIYTIETLPDPQKEAIIEGVQMVAAYMCESATTKELKLRLPYKENGNVSPFQVGLSKLDPMVELHLLAVPLDRHTPEVVGLAGIGSGVAYVDTNESSPAVVRQVSSHETAHAFGFVQEDAKHVDPESPHHCSDEGCIMHMSVLTQDPEESSRLIDRAKRRGFLGKRHAERADRAMHTKVVNQHDFCLDCAIDMRTESEKNIAELRTERLLNGMPKGFRK